MEEENDPIVPAGRNISRGHQNDLENAVDAVVL